MAACAPSSGPEAPVDGSDTAIAASDTIIGKAVSPDVVRVLTASHRLYRLSVPEQRIVDVARLGLEAGADVWGLARANDALWTLVGFRELARLDDDGRLVEKIGLPNPVMAVYGWQDGLILQEAALQPDEPALQFWRPGSPERRGFGDLRLRGFATRPEVLVGNMVSCGSTAGGEIPCWFSHTLEVHRIGRGGGTRVMQATGLGLEPLAADGGTLSVDQQVVPPRPVRDAYIDRAGDLWLLAMKLPVEDTDARPAGEQLAHYATTGELLGVISLAEPARLILGFVEDRVLLLSVTGRFLAVPRS